MLKHWEDPEVVNFIQRHRQSEIHEVALKLHRYPQLPKEFILDQINGLQKVNVKIPAWAVNEKLIFPSKVSFEQCSSSETACYKSSLVPNCDRIVDLTGGFGVDASFIAEKCNEYVFVERSLELCNIVRHNFEVLGISNVRIITTDSSQIVIEQSDLCSDWLYLDPARRDKQQQKVFEIEDCEPNVKTLQEHWWKITSNIMLKLSPMVDLTKIIKTVDCVKEIHVVSVKNECKEVLCLLEKNYTGKVKYKAVNILKEESMDIFDVKNHCDVSNEVTYSEPLGFVYEPNASIMKIGDFKELALRFGLNKLAPNTHLFTSETFVEGFPGRVFEMIEILPYRKNSIKERLPDMKANLSVRNFGESVEEIKKRLGIKDGGSNYIIATSTVKNTKAILLCKKHLA